jgi:acid ceramidase
VLGVTGLPSTTVSAQDKCTGDACLKSLVLNFPKTVYPVTPRFDFSFTGLTDQVAKAPKFNATGSLGLPNHPLGIFGFKTSGSACGEQKLYLEDGVLAVITVDFPPCPWPKSLKIGGHVDVWTTIPAVPVVPPFGVSTGFTFELHVQEDNDATQDYTTELPLSACNAYNDCNSCRQIAFCNFCPLDNKCDNDDVHLRTKCHGKAECIGPKCNVQNCSAPPAPPPAPAGTKELISLTVGLAQPAGSGADPQQDNCTLDFEHMPAYPPPKSLPGLSDTSIPSFVVDLDVDPETRWDHIVRPRAADIKAMIDQFTESIGGLKSKLLRTILDLGTEALLKKVPAPYAAEIQGIAKSTGLDVVEIFVYNIMYEVEGLCTSMVSQDSNGHIYHSRNLDFGLFDGTDNKTRTWSLTEKLRPLLMNLNFVKGGISIYNTTQYAGFVGLLTGVKKGGFSISVDTRFDGHLDEYLILWLLGKYEGSFLSWKLRDVMENVGSYSEALHDLTTYKPMGPSYIILGGAKATEGAVIALKAGSTTPQTVRLLSDALKNNSFYVAQTNYDWPAAPPAFDDRRYPLEDCMHKLGSARIAWNTLWAVHSSTPTKNALTTYTTLMSAETGHFEAYKQLCLPGPNCFPFMGANLFRASSMFTPEEFLVV